MRRRATRKRPSASAKEGEAVYGDREPTAADYSALAYTRAVIQETMRIYPPIWGLIRVANERRRDRRQGNQSRRPRRAVRLWRAPQSELLGGRRKSSVPERWMAGAAKKQVKYTYLPFGGGKRSCIGGAMSQVENTLALSILLRRFRPEYVGDEPPRHQRHGDADAQGRPQVPHPRTELGVRLLERHSSAYRRSGRNEAGIDRYT